MTDLLAARSQMAMSLAFHIIFAVVGIGMPVLMVVAERRWQRTGDRFYLDLAHRWAKGTAILFAVGAVSGSAELRARPALARLHGACRRHHRHALLPRGIRLLHRGDLPRCLPLRMGPHLRHASSVPIRRFRVPLAG